MTEHLKTVRNGAIAAVSAAGVVAALAAAACFGPSLAIADNSADSSTTFGIGSVTTSTTSAVGVLSSDGASSELETTLLSAASASDTSVLATSVNYDVMVGVYQIEAEREAERLAAEEAARIDEQEHIDQALANKAAWEAVMSDSDAAAYDQLDEVDWEAGKEAFIEEWGTRIDAYLSRTVLAGYGQVFAEAAWEYGVDPRWSPAISNTESGNGTNCFLPHNAWGWGSSSWSSWTEAINAHVAGLAKGYGYSITYSFAAKYCPPNTEHWFNNTIGQMALI